MKCLEVYAWLLMPQSTPQLPKAVRHHLKTCARCQVRHSQLLLLDEEMTHLPRPSPNPETKARFLAQLEQPTAVSTDARPGNRRRWLLLWLRVACVALLVAGMFWLMVGPSNRDAQPTPAIRVAPEPEDKLIAQFVEHHVHLAATFQAGEQTVLLNAMGLDLQAEAVRLAKQGEPDDLPLLAALYQAVLRRGLLGRLRHLSAPQRQQMLPGIINQLQETQSDIEEAMKDRSQVVGDYLEPIRSTAQEMSKLLQSDDGLRGADLEPLPAFAGSAGSAPALLALLVTQSLRIAEESDPLKRAYCCNELADQLALASKLALARGEDERAARLNKYVVAIVLQGVGTNVARLQTESPQDPHLSALEDAILRARRTVEALESTRPPKPGEEREPLAPDDPRFKEAKDLEKELKGLEKALKDITKGKKEKTPPPPPPKGGPKGKEPW